jgi:hypothetical protein
MAGLNLTLPNLKLNDGNSMPMLGYGTGTAWSKRGEESKTDQAVVDGVKMAIKLGYMHLDGAESMGHFSHTMKVQTNVYFSVRVTVARIPTDSWTCLYSCAYVEEFTLMLKAMQNAT